MIIFGKYKLISGSYVQATVEIHSIFKFSSLRGSKVMHISCTSAQVVIKCHDFFETSCRQILLLWCSWCWWHGSELCGTKFGDYLL